MAIDPLPVGIRLRDAPIAVGRISRWRLPPPSSLTGSNGLHPPIDVETSSIRPPHGEENENPYPTPARGALRRFAGMPLPSDDHMLKRFDYGYARKPHAATMYMIYDMHRRLTRPACRTLPGILAAA